MKPWKDPDAPFKSTLDALLQWGHGDEAVERVVS